jgi:hypothetical protein
MPASQAGRRGFEPRLPLHVFNGLRGFSRSESIEKRSNWSKSSYLINLQALNASRERLRNRFSWLSIGCKPLDCRAECQSGTLGLRWFGSGSYSFPNRPSLSSRAFRSNPSKLLPSRTVRTCNIHEYVARVRFSLSLLHLCLSTASGLCAAWRTAEPLLRYAPFDSGSPARSGLPPERHLLASGVAPASVLASKTTGTSEDKECGSRTPERQTLC